MLAAPDCLGGGGGSVTVGVVVDSSGVPLLQLLLQLLQLLLKRVMEAAEGEGDLARPRGVADFLFGLLHLLDVDPH